MIDPEVMRRLDQQASLIRQLQGSLGGMRIVRGVIDTSGSGSIIEGTGFSVTRHGTGDVTITFTEAFADVPSVVATIEQDVAANYVRLRSGVAPTSSTARISAFTFAGAAGETRFHFIAIGPA